MDKQRQDVQPEPTYSSSVPIRDIARRICRKQWTIGRRGERASGISVLIACHDIYIYIYILQSHTHTYTYIRTTGSHDVMVIVVGNGHGDTSPNPGRGCFH